MTSVGMTNTLYVDPAPPPPALSILYKYERTVEGEQ